MLLGFAKKRWVRILLLVVGLPVVVYGVLVGLRLNRFLVADSTLRLALEGARQQYLEKETLPSNEEAKAYIRSRSNYYYAPSDVFTITWAGAPDTTHSRPVRGVFQLQDGTRIERVDSIELFNQEELRAIGL